MLATLANLRVLPVTIFVAFFLLTVKVGTIWEGVGDWMDGVSVSKAGAEAEEGGLRPKSAREILEKRHPSPPKVLELAQANTDALSDEEKAAIAEEEAAIQAEEKTAKPDSSFIDDPTFYTQAEVDLLQKLAERREEIEAQARELDVRENLLKAAEARIDKKVQSLKALQLTIEESMVKYDEEQENKLQNLVKIYENMKPKDAGRIFEELEMDVLLQVAEKMNNRRLAPILAKMAPQKARDVTEELFRLRSLPKPGELAVGQ
ncbi:MotE family protein [Terasakiella pusilla]|uniref:MotE family protein n=1 Tax=Terasakiella pusilla TaxID=64973 RepID=UPI003AA99711